MSFRARLLLAFTAATLLPLALLAFGLRRQVTARLTAQHQRRVDALARVVEQDLARESVSIGTRLATLTRALADDDRFRLAAVHGSATERGFLLDYAANAIRLTDLSMLQLQDDQGRIISSGHFRNEFDRLEPELPRLLAAAGDAAALVRARAPDGPFLALARTDSVRVGGRAFALVGGIVVDQELLRRFARDGELTVSLRAPTDTIVSDTVSRPGGAADAAVAADLPLPFVDTRVPDSARLVSAQLVISHSPAELEALRSEVQRWFLFALAAAVAGALALAGWLSARLSRPLADLARATSTIDLDGPHVELATSRDDEIGTLARRLAGMMRRLRASASKLRDAERRATVGEMARQVNHDIKNGLIPIRNVLRHLAQVQEGSPHELPGVFAERRATLESSVGYLDTLARSYGRLTPNLERRPVDVNGVVRELVQSTAGVGGVEVYARLADALPPVVGDPLVLRRIVDNLLRNAIESIDPRAGKPGTVTLQTARTAEGGVRVIVADTGRGMSEEELAHAFDDFFTTKPGGTGLGLSVVRRLTADLQGTLRVESEPGRGTIFTLDLPAAAHSVPPVTRDPRPATRDHAQRPHRR